MSAADEVCSLFGVKIGLLSRSDLLPLFAGSGTSGFSFFNALLKSCILVPPKPLWSSEILPLASSGCLSDFLLLPSRSSSSVDFSVVSKILMASPLSSWGSYRCCCSSRISSKVFCGGFACLLTRTWSTDLKALRFQSWPLSLLFDETPLLLFN